MRGLEGENPKELDTAKAVFQAAEAAEEKRPMLFGPVSPAPNTLQRLPAGRALEWI